MIQLSMGLEWVFLLRGDVSPASSAGFYHIVSWKCYRMDCILSTGLYRIVWIVSYRLDHTRKHWILCDGWLLAGWDRWNGWGVGETGVIWNKVSRRRNRSDTIGSGTRTPPLALEGRRAVGSGGWHQLSRCCKGAEYLCLSSLIIQMYCTKIVTNMY